MLKNIKTFVSCVFFISMLIGFTSQASYALEDTGDNSLYKSVDSNSLECNLLDSKVLSRVDSVAQSSSIYYLDADLDDADVIEKYFYENIQAQKNPSTFHFFSHGKPGKLLINGQWLSGQALITSLKNILPADVKQLNIYGCGFAEGDNGTNLVNQLQQSLNINVAASDDTTDVDGDWDLEVGKSNNIVAINDNKHYLPPIWGVYNDRGLGEDEIIVTTPVQGIVKFTVKNGAGQLIGTGNQDPTANPVPGIYYVSNSDFVGGPGPARVIFDDYLIDHNNDGILQPNEYAAQLEDDDESKRREKGFITLSLAPTTASYVTRRDNEDFPSLLNDPVYRTDTAKFYGIDVNEVLTLDEDGSGEIEFGEAYGVVIETDDPSQKVFANYRMRSTLDSPGKNPLIKVPYS